MPVDTSCQSCRSKNTTKQGLMEGKVRITCQECGYSSIMNGMGKQYLTGGRSGAGAPARPAPGYLTEG